MFGSSFSFSQPATTPSLFGQTNGTPTFGAATTPAPSLFGQPAASTPAWGAASQPATNTFGAPATTTFGAMPTASPSRLFGAPQAASTPSMFGAASTPSIFGAASTPSMFGASLAPALNSLFGNTTSPAPSMFGAPQQQASALTMQPPPSILSYSTRYDELPADKQQGLQEIHRMVSTFREDCDKLDRDVRLHDNASMSKCHLETGSLKRSLVAMLNTFRSDDEALTEFREKVQRLLRSTEYAIRTYQRAKIWRDAPSQYRGGQVMPSQLQEILSSPVILPSPYLEQAIQGFQQTLAEYRRVISELEQALPPDARGVGTDEASMTQTLPLVISHLHEYFTHVAAKLSKLHKIVEEARKLQQQQGGVLLPTASPSRNVSRLGGENLGMPAFSSSPVLIPPSRDLMTQGRSPAPFGTPVRGF